MALEAMRRFFYRGGGGGCDGGSPDPAIPPSAGRHGTTPSPPSPARQPPLTTRHLESTSHDQLRSAFFGRLPLEVRRQIYRDLWATSGLCQHIYRDCDDSDNDINSSSSTSTSSSKRRRTTTRSSSSSIKSRNPARFRHSPCVADHAAPDDRDDLIDEAYRRRKAEASASAAVDSLTHPGLHRSLNSPWTNHYRCHEALGSRGGAPSPGGPFLPALLCCKRMHLEAMDSLGEHMTFTFTSVDAAHDFFSSFLPPSPANGRAAAAAAAADEEEEGSRLDDNENNNSSSSNIARVVRRLDLAFALSHADLAAYMPWNGGSAWARLWAPALLGPALLPSLRRVRLRLDGRRGGDDHEIQLQGPALLRTVLLPLPLSPPPPRATLADDGDCDRQRAHDDHDDDAAAAADDDDDDDGSSSSYADEKQLGHDSIDQSDDDDDNGNNGNNPPPLPYDLEIDLPLRAAYEDLLLLHNGPWAPRYAAPHLLQRRRQRRRQGGFVDLRFRDPAAWRPCPGSKSHAVLACPGSGRGGGAGEGEDGDEDGAFLSSLDLATWHGMSMVL